MRGALLSFVRLLSLTIVRSTSLVRSLVFLSMCVHLALSPSMAQVVTNDSLALVDLYNATNGSQWLSNANWLTSNPVGTWTGIQVAGGRVTQIQFPFGNNLQGDLPASMGNLTGLQSLELGWNGITSMPPEIGNLVSVQTLSLAYNQISQVPSTLVNMSGLSFLDLSGNSITSLPDQIGLLTSLESLHAEANQISTLPPSIGGLVNLKTLNAMNNQLGALPTEMANLRQLKFFYLGGNALSDLPVSICSLDSLELLWLYSNQLTSLPNEIGNLTKLRNLHFQGNSLQSLPSTIGNLTQLTNLHLGENQLRTLPPEVGNLTNLRSLRLYYNQLDSLPATIGNLTALGDLWLQHNNLTSLPEGIGNLTNITHLWLDDNSLSGNFPDTLGNLTNLVLLSLRNNFLTGHVPDRIGELTGLGWLFLEDNRLDELPSFAGATSLSVLTVYQNQLTFEDIERNISLSLTSFSYALQDSLGEERDTTVQAGSTFESSVTVGGSANYYQWTKNGLDMPGADSSNLVLSAVDSSDSGTYLCRVISGVVPILEIYSRPTHVLVQGSVGVEEADNALPSTFALDQNCPNPFNPTTRIKYQIPNSNDVTLKVLDILGREVRTLVNEVKTAGEHSLTFDATGLTSGVYFYRLRAGSFFQTRKMTVLR